MVKVRLILFLCQQAKESGVLGGNTFSICLSVLESNSSQMITFRKVEFL